MAIQGANYMGMMSILPDLSTLAAQMGLPAVNFRKMGHTGASPADDFDIADYIPALGAATRTVGGADTVIKGATGQDITDGDKRAAIGALPFATVIGVKPILEAMTDSEK